MVDPNIQSNSSGSRFRVSMWLPALILGGLLIITLTIQLVLSWEAHQRLTPVNRHLNHMLKLQDTNLELQRELVESLSDNGEFTLAERGRMRSEIKTLLALKSHLAGNTPQVLKQAHRVLADVSVHPKEALILALVQTRKAIDLENQAHQQLIEHVNRATALELQIGMATLLVFPAGAILLIFLLRRRILAPLDRLSFLMTLLAKRDYSQAPINAIDPMLRPLTENYNAMVARLIELEEEHKSREHDLELQVQNATCALLDQHRSLANTERLAALGEMMARIAHELRNPLAGVKLACTNLRQDMNQNLQSSDDIERIDIITAEINRIIAVLNSLLDQSRHKPEPLRDIALAEAVADLITLARYQIPEHIRLKQRISKDIVCRLPDALLRQALLNLLLNAQQAIGGKGGEIVVDAEVEDSMVRLRVCDDGPGFPRHLLEAGIRAFVTHRAQGTGLGLSMVQRFVRAYGGNLMLSNVQPHGACVLLELPCGRNHG